MHQHGKPLATEVEKALAEKFIGHLDETPAAQPACDLSQEDLLAIDLAYHHKKTSGALLRERDRRALEDQVQFFRREGAL